MEQKHLAIASSSSKTFSETVSEPVGESEKADILKCLNTIQKIVNTLKHNVNVTFLDTLEKLLEVAVHSKSDAKLDLINIVLANIFEATTDELAAVQQDFINIFHTKIDKKYIVDDDKIESIRILGMGAFGVVYSGLLVKADGKSKPVAIKRSRESCYRKLIRYEASILSRLDHENILKLYAINKSSSEMAIELMSLGHLGHAAELYKFSKVNVMKILKDVANGMEYLSGKKYLHRDLACRNVFLNSRKQCKIGDFAFCVYVGDSDGVHIETEYDPKGYNVSPETLLTREFRVETDIWAMGILVWEFFYVTEYSNVIPPASFTKNIHLRRFEQSKEWLPRPSNFPKTLYLYIMENMLNRDLEKRPPFSDIKDKIAEFILQNR